MKLKPTLVVDGRASRPTLIAEGRASARASAEPRTSEAVSVRVVIVTLDSHLASVTERAQHILRRELPGLALSLHAASEWGDDPQALERCPRISRRATSSS